MTIKAGVLSDTHLIRPDSAFKRRVRSCFHDCDVIIHAGDITEAAVLDVFDGQVVHAVHGNMCSRDIRGHFPQSATFTLGNFTIGLTHGAHLGYDIETNLWDLFPEVDCMIYGHTHRPICRTIGGVIVMNPGSFRSTGQHGSPGTYGTLEAGEKLIAGLHEIPLLP